MGSIQDQTLRAYLQKKTSQEVAKARLLAQIAIATGSNGDKTWSRTISNIWNDFLRSVYYLEAEHEDLEKDMLEEYQKIKHLRPKITKQKDGSLKVTGLPK